MLLTYQVTLHWSALTEQQQRQFLAALHHMIALLTTSEDTLFFAFYREGAFNHERETTEQISEEVAHRVAQDLKVWIQQQQEIYTEKLQQATRCTSSIPSHLPILLERSEHSLLLLDSLRLSRNRLLSAGPGGSGKSELAKYRRFYPEDAVRSHPLDVQ